MLFMLLVTAVAPLFLLATRVTADPIGIRSSPISLPIVKRINRNGLINLTQRDRSRVRNLLKCGTPVVETTLDNTVFDYTISLGVGKPATYYVLIVDTGSSNTWIGANKSYNPTSTSEVTPDSFNVMYGLGSVFGFEYIDTVTIAPGVKIRQSIGVAEVSYGVSPYDGIFGIGPTNLTFGTLYPDNTSVIPTVTDNLFEQGKIKQNLVAVSFEPTNSSLAMNGEITFGGTNSTKHTGNITCFPRTKAYPASLYWGVDMAFRYGNASVTTGILDTTAGIVDTGTNLVYLATGAYNLYVQETGGVIDIRTGLLSITSAQYDNLQSLFIDIGDTTYELNANAQIWPRSLNTYIGGKADGIYLVVADLGGDVSGGFDFIFGMTFLERLYSVYDTGKNCVGFATTQFTNSTDINW